MYDRGRELLRLKPPSKEYKGGTCVPENDGEGCVEIENNVSVINGADEFLDFDQ